MQVTYGLTDCYCIEHDNALSDAPAKNQTRDIELLHAGSENYEASDVEHD